MKRKFLGTSINLDLGRRLSNNDWTTRNGYYLSIYLPTVLFIYLSTFQAIYLSRPWKEAMQIMTGQPEMDTGAIREYFKYVYIIFNSNLLTYLKGEDNGS